MYVSFSDVVLQGMRHYFTEFANDQWINEETFEWSCTCRHGSFGRFRKGNNKPCICILNALNKLTWKLIKEHWRKKNEVVKESV